MPCSVGRLIGTSAPPTPTTTALASAWFSSRSQLAAYSDFAFEREGSTNILVSGVEGRSGDYSKGSGKRYPHYIIHIMQSLAGALRTPGTALHNVALCKAREWRASRALCGVSRGRKRAGQCLLAGMVAGVRVSLANHSYPPTRATRSAAEFW